MKLNIQPLQRNHPTSNWGDFRRRQTRQRKKRESEARARTSHNGVDDLDLSCSDIYSSTRGSLALQTHDESAYIYAQSIQASDTSTPGISHDFTSDDAIQHYRLKRPGFRDIEWADSACSIEAVCGSTFCSNESQSSVNSDDDLYNSHSLAEAQWGSASSRSNSEASSYTTQYTSESSFSSTESHVFNSSYLEHASCDLYNASTQSSPYSNSKDFPTSELKAELDFTKYQGVVTNTSSCCDFGPVFREMIKAAVQEKKHVNEGFLFHSQKFLQVKNGEYREGQHYSVLRHIQSGSYGDVFSVRDKHTGFTCAAKRIPINSFSWEEVGTWSRLDSPQVLQLYGVIREGLNIILFMDLKPGSVGQMLKVRGKLSENEALFYHRQVLQALHHLHCRNIIHLDVKVDNVLLSEDGRSCFLCDFGSSEMLDQTGYSTKTFRGNGLRGTESHMAPEVARGDPRSGKADIWSSCCMLLHMLSGHQPWTRYYTHPLCLKIVSESAPLWEIPPGCDPLTCDVIRGGLVKEPSERDTARELLDKSGRALKAVSGLSDPDVQVSSFFQLHPPIKWQNVAAALSNSPLPRSSSTCTENKHFPRMQWVSMWREQAAEEDGMDSDWREGSDSDTDEFETEEQNDWLGRYWKIGVSLSEAPTWFLKKDGVTEGQRTSQGGGSSDSKMRSLVVDEDGESDYEKESDLGSLRELCTDWTKEEWEPLGRHHGVKAKWKTALSDDQESETDECKTSSTSVTSVNSPEPNSRLIFACHRSVCNSEPEFTDKASDWSDDLSSGVFSSCSSLSDQQSFGMDWSVSTNQPQSCCFEGLGVDIWVEDVSGNTFRIRERLKVKLGHVALGISAQISIRAFTLVRVDGEPMSPDTEVVESGAWLLCVPALDTSTSWFWRIKDGKLERQEAESLTSDTCSTLAT